MLPQQRIYRRQTMPKPLVALSLLVLLVAPRLASADAEPSRSAWECLPQETTLAIRIPNGEAFASALKQRTKLGSVLLSDDRLKRIGELVVEQDKTAWDQFHTRLQQYGLRAEDLPRLLAGESGFAIVLGTSEGPAPQVAGLGWLEPGQDLAARLVEAIGKAVDDLADKDQAVKRVEFEITGQPVMQLNWPIAHNETDAEKLELPEDFDELSEEDQRKAIQDAQKDVQVQKTVRYQCALLARLGGRILWATTLQGTPEGVPEPVVEQLTSLMGRFLAAHTQEPGGFVSHVTAAAGVRDLVAQSGIAGLEIFGDATPLVNLAQGDSDSMPAKVIKALGVERLGAVVIRVTLDGSLLRSGFFAAAPVPRTGVLALLDQPAVPAEPPSWVPADIVDYSHLSADLGKMYTQIKDLVLREVGPQADATFQMAEANVQGFAQADLATVLSSLGHLHSVVTYEPDVQAAKDGAKAEAEAEDEPLVTSDPGQRLAIVWKVKDEAIWTRLLQAAGAFAPLANGALQPTDEQGFRGWRMTGEPYEGGLVLGQGFLVMGVGKGVLERTLASLNNPPDGKDALRSGELFSRAQTLLDLQPGVSFQLTDGNRYAKTLRKLIDTLLDASGATAELAEDDSLEEEATNANIHSALLDEIRKLMPSEEELDGMLGVSAGYMLVNEHGLVSKAVSELPPGE